MQLSVARAARWHITAVGTCVARLKTEWHWHHFCKSDGIQGEDFRARLCQGRRMPCSYGEGGCPAKKKKIPLSS